MDEAAHFLTEQDGDRAAEQVWEALAPSTAQFGGHARIIMASTPFGTSGLFADMWARANGGEIEDAVAQHATTAEVNPTITPSFLAAEQVRDPDSHKSEYLAEFTGSGAGFLDFARIDLAGAPTAAPEDAQVWVAGHDPAFSRDAYGLALVGRTIDGGLVVGPVRALRSEGSFTGPVDEAAAITRDYGASAVTDQYSSAAVVERLRDEHGLSVAVNTMTPQSKTAIFQALRERLYDGSLALPDDPSLIAELRRLRTRYTAGSAAVTNPRVGGSHGDQAQALALAVYALGSVTTVSAPPVLYRPSRWAPVGLNTHPGLRGFA